MRMPTSPAGRATRRAPVGRDVARVCGQPVAQRGFTLVELLVVLSILSLLSVGAALSIGGRSATPLAGRMATQLADDIAYARDQALLGRTLWGLRPEPGRGWQVLRLGADGSWQPGLAERRFERGSIQWFSGGQPIVAGAADGPPPIVIAPEGRMTPLDIRLSHAGQSRRCVSTGVGGITC